MKFELGDRVYYVSGRHITSLSNPLKSSDYKCMGTIGYTGGTSIKVDWDNGSDNIYSEIDLELVEPQLQDTNPNKLFSMAGKRRK